MLIGYGKVLKVFVLVSLFMLSHQVSFASQASDLTDVSKNSKLSDYFQKVSAKMSDDSEEQSLDKKPSANKSIDAEEGILLEAATRKTEAESPLSPLQKMMLSVLVLIVVAGVSFVGMKKVGSKVGHKSIAQNIKVLAQKPLGPRKNLMLIRVAGETILLGVTDQNINHLKTLSLMEDELPSYTDPKFSNQLKTKIEQTKINDKAEEVDGFSVSRLDDVKNAVSKRFLV